MTIARWWLRVIFAGAVAAMLLVVPSVSAHPGNTWWWGVGKAELRLSQSPQVRVAFRASAITYVSCTGRGNSWYTKANNGKWTKLYKHHTCLIQFEREEDCDEYGYCTTYEYEVERVLHVVGPNLFKLSTG